MTIAIEPIAFIRTPYKQKFAIPRQPGLADAALGEIQFVEGLNDADFIRGIEQFSHLWLLFHFHQTHSADISALVRPPRLGGNQKIGVFASRSTHRPNNIGMSVVKLIHVEQRKTGPCLIVSGMDLVDMTPIVDIKPYLPYADAITDAQAGYAQAPPTQSLEVVFSKASLATIARHETTYPQLFTLIQQVLSQDPRPAYQQGKASDRIYGVKLFDFDVHWRVEQAQCIVEQILLVETSIR
ncbi:tRNA (N6-threonylcarbamoyladenosine(37)-N6)-methyltransferase TrmO [Aliiglaciecola litoralis]|uniref:tRNA (N6-threonylcarbamoyladenosine(37)-N6)-methyltransferase TrmO n=1 Tax=Aliiglaciecola litoralis TaxID=582857 RepID=A0ABN1LII5_9ALTE